MLSLDIYNLKAEKIKKLTLPKEIFGFKVNKTLLAQAVRVYLSNQRQAAAKAKTRGEVDASGRKIYRQKGTGRARHGDRKAPIFVKGGKAHGPTGTQNYKLKLAKKMKKQAIFSALTSKLQAKQIIMIDGILKVKPKTKEMVKIIDKFKIKNLIAKDKKTKLTVILPDNATNVVLASRNIANMTLMQANAINVYEILNGGKIIIMPESLAIITKTFLH